MARRKKKIRRDKRKELKEVRVKGRKVKGEVKEGKREGR